MSINSTLPAGYIPVRNNRTWNYFSLLCLALLSIGTSYAQVSGTVFRDYDGNGLKQNAEGGVSGVAVKAVLPNGTFVSTTTGPTGTYAFTAGQIPATTKVRLEFSSYPSGNFSGPFSAMTGGSKRHVGLKDGKLGQIYVSDFSQAATPTTTCAQRWPGNAG